jgi:hypothetical protein
MKEFAAFVLPPALAMTGMRMNRALLGKDLDTRLGFGARFALGLASAMAVFSQIILLAVLLGANIAGPLAWAAFIWGLVEFVLLIPQGLQGLKDFKIQPAHLWSILLLPLLYVGWIFGRLSVLEGTLEFDAMAFWVFKAKIMYLVQGKAFLDCLHQSNLGYIHWDYPMLVPGIYTLGYGLMGQVDEFVNKVWPFWMDVALVLAVLSLGNFWRRPRLLTAAMVLVFGFLPATFQFTRWEGGTIPMVFYISLSALLVVNALLHDSEIVLAAAVLVVIGCACAKLDGFVYGAIWACVLAHNCWLRGWLKKKVLWKAAASVVLLVPYALLRLQKPVAHYDSFWWRSGVATPATVLHRFPQTLFLEVCGRFFSHASFQWTNDQNHLKWTGQWTGWTCLINDQLFVLPWLVLPLLALGLWKARNRPAAISLSITILGMMAFLALVIACLAYVQADLAQGIAYNIGSGDRYFFPLFTAWFLGLASLWFPEPTPAAAEPTKPTKPAPQLRKK